jgi:glycosyl transferase family 2
MRPAISVIAPTRNRVPLLDHMLTTLDATVSDPARVEVILRCDYDDVLSIAYLCQRGTPFIVGSRREGYATLATFINEAARLSTGELVIVVNDDVEFLTADWDLRLTEAAAEYPDGIFDLGVNTVLNNPNFVFPCQSRRQIEVLGCFFDERLIYPDIWLRDVLLPFGRAIRVPEVTIQHNWLGQSEDQAVAASVAHSSAHQAVYQRCVNEGRAKISTVLQPVCR